MSAIVAVQGQVRKIAERRKKAVSGQGPGEVWGASVSVLTEIGESLGETLNVTVFVRDLRGLDPQIGEEVNWVVEISTGQYGLEAVFQRVLAVAVAA